MDSAPDSFIFFQIPSHLAAQAYAFHKSQSSNEHIWPRTEDQIRQYAEDGELFGVRRASNGEFVGLCYSTLDGEHGDEWEIGGLTVPEAMRDLHLATFLVRFATAYTIAMQRPWHYKQEIIAYVHKENDKPRNLLGRIGFEFKEPVLVDGGIAPPSMKRNADGKIPGDKFCFPKTSVKALLNWFENEFKGKLGDGKTEASFDTFGGLRRLVEDLREAAA
jgi:RimJ/RimL family protein N-acetyltransferase